MMGEGIVLSSERDICALGDGVQIEEEVAIVLSGPSIDA